MIIAITAVFTLPSLASCTKSSYVYDDSRYSAESVALRTENTELIKKEIKACYDFLWGTANLDEDTFGCGLMLDKTLEYGKFASIASVGFGLAILPAAVDYGWIDKATAQKRANNTLNTFINNLYNYKGLFYHFLDPETGERWGNTEISTIDSAIFFCGAITAGEYFGGKTKRLAEKVSNRANWRAFVQDNNGRNMYRMSCKPNEDGSMEWSSWWNMYNEHLMIQFLGAGASKKSHRVTETYDLISKPRGTYTSNTTGESVRFIHSFRNSFFIHQFSHAFYDFYGYEDADGIDWYDNSVKASLGQYYFALDNQDNPLYGDTFSAVSYGVSALSTPDEGYNAGTGGLGVPPSGSGGGKQEYNVLSATTKTVWLAPYAATSSMVFTPAQSMGAFKNYMSKEELWHPTFGLYESFNVQRNMVHKTVLGIDKGITAIMLINFLDGGVWRHFMKSPIAQRGFDNLGFVKVTPDYKV